ncbi:hypothetical protein NDU88_003933 [Pleurodeles waltl]|uniref:Uncharacterized protein n=1 Tax=Pleurodeles waltl TaxID=8319 RepID=A0AAV7W3I9_PLEWA|nr:hypothetical protein NDU88_003933 [Pleurodeles waltl]
MEALFTSLINDLQVVKKDLSADLREVRRNMEELGDRVSVVKDRESRPDKKVERQHQEVLHLQKQHIKLQTHAEDLEDCSQRNNIRIH